MVKVEAVMTKSGEISTTGMKLWSDMFQVLLITLGVVAVWLWVILLFDLSTDVARHLITITSFLWVGAGAIFGFLLGLHYEVVDVVEYTTIEKYFDFSGHS